MCWYFNKIGMDPIDCDGKVKKQQQLKPINKINTTYTSILSYNWFVVVLNIVMVSIVVVNNICGVVTYGGCEVIQIKQ